MSFLVLALMVPNPAGAASMYWGGICLARIVAWGQTRTHWLHWMQFSGIHIGTSGATPRRSRRAVPDGTCPSSGILETGIVSPWNRIVGSMTLFVNSSTSSGMSLGLGAETVIFSGIGTAVSPAVALSTASQFISTTSIPFLR